MKVHFCIDDLCHRNICRQSQVYPDHWEQGWQGWVERYYLDSKWLESNTREAGVGEGSEQHGMLDLFPFLFLEHSLHVSGEALLIPCECRTETWENRTVVMMHIWNFLVVLRWQSLWRILKLQCLEQISVLAGSKAIVRSTFFHYAYQMPSSIHHCSASSHYQALVLWLLVVVLCLFLY